MPNFNDRNIVSDTSGSVLDQLYGVPGAPQQKGPSVSRILTAPSVVQSVQGDPPAPFPAGEIDDYDFAAAKAAGVEPDDRGHWPDTYKRPNHITFSDESIFNDGGAGHWENIDNHWYFTPGPTNLKNYSMEHLRRYFKQFEPDVTL